jgi:hypothetical protein
MHDLLVVQIHICFFCPVQEFTIHLKLIVTLYLFQCLFCARQKAVGCVRTAWQQSHKQHGRGLQYRKVTNAAVLTWN